MTNQHQLDWVAKLIAQHNAVDAEISAIIGRPALPGHLGEWIAAHVFELQLESSAAAKSIDGRSTLVPASMKRTRRSWSRRSSSDRPARSQSTVRSSGRENAARHRCSTLEPSASGALNMINRGITEPASCSAEPVDGRGRHDQRIASRMSSLSPNQLDDELSPLVLPTLLVARLGEADHHAWWRNNGASSTGAFGMSIT